MLMMGLSSAKVTERKVRWDAICDDGVPFSLYIPQWRVPEPWPLKIRVGFDPMAALPEGTPCLTESMAALNPAARMQAIITLVEKKVVNEHTVRYVPLGKQIEWQIGKPYIPYSILPEKAPERLRVIVEWGPSPV